MRNDFERGLDWLLAEPTSVSSRGLERPASTVGSGALGYYIIYQVILPVPGLNHTVSLETLTRITAVSTRDPINARETWQGASVPNERPRFGSINSPEP